MNAAGNALTDMMGLVCDPVAGLVEVPCQKRNASGAATALMSAQTSLAGIGNLVGFDQTVEAMYKVGRSLPFELGAAPSSWGAVSYTHLTFWLVELDDAVLTRGSFFGCIMLPGRACGCTLLCVFVSAIVQ